MNAVIAKPVKVKTFPVMEVFGPVLQGEGALAGVPTYFVRFGGCDFRCTWCDSMFAVEPVSVRENARRLSDVEIVNEIVRGKSGPEWVTLSGGNPALHQLGGLVQMLHECGLKSCVETQGTRWKDWLLDVDCLTVSPKPPSSGMLIETNRQLPTWMSNAAVYTGMRALKIVCFDEADYEWACGVFAAYPSWPAYLSVGTDPVTQWDGGPPKPESHESTLMGVATRYAWISERVAQDPRMRRVTVLPQLHVIAYGHKRGV